MYHQLMFKKNFFKSFFKLLIKYYSRNYLIMTYLIFFPLGILSFEYFLTTNTIVSELESEILITYIKRMIINTMMIQVMLIGLQIIANTIIEFRNSIIFKHFGTMQVNPLTFLVTIILFGFILSFITVLMIIFWVIVLFANKFPILELLNFINFSFVGYLFVAIVTSISFGNLLATFLKTQKQHLLISNFLFVWMIIFSGNFLPDLINNFLFMKTLSYLSIFRYSGTLLLNNISILENNELLLNISIAILLPIIFFIIAIRWWKWYE